MTPFDELAGLAMALAVPVAGFFGCAYVVRFLDRRRGELPPAAEELAARLGHSLTPLDGAELAGLVSEGILGADARASPAVRWEAPDATFCALIVAHRQGPEGIVVVTPRDAVEAKPRLAEVLHRSPRDSAPIPLSDDLKVRHPDVVAIRLGGRLVVRQPNVDSADALERLLMCACAILDG
jgi:hypothetical protein